MSFLSKLLPPHKPIIENEILALYANPYGEDDTDLGVTQSFQFIISKAHQKEEIGKISLRYGESRCLYYFGHIGYHINPPYRGHGYAAEACRMLLPLLQRLHCYSVVITTNLDNIASRKTCEHLDCVLENIVTVPDDLQEKFELDSIKLRYVWRIPKIGIDKV